MNARSLLAIVLVVTASLGALVATLLASTGRPEASPIPTTDVTTPVTAPSPTPSPALPSTEPADRCAAARADVEASGLGVPDGFAFMCPAEVDRLVGHGKRWGAACAEVAACPRQAYVGIDLTAIGESEARLRYVTAHEICHAVHYVSGQPFSEEAADSCAAAHGFPFI